MRAPSAILKSLSSWRMQPKAATAAVAPLLVTTQFNRELTAELDTLHCGKLGLAQLLDAAINTQKIALDSLVKNCYKDDGVDRLALEEYLENNIDILDACNYFVERIDDMKKYVNTLRVVTHLVGSGSSMAAIARALELLESCHHGIEKKLKPKGKRCLFPRPVCFYRASIQKLQRVTSESGGRQDAKLRVTKHTLSRDENEFSEIVCGSMAIALMGCNFLQLGLSLDSRSGVLPKTKKHCHSHPKCSFSWWMLLQEVTEHKRRSGSLVMAELLQHAVIAARELKEQLKGKRVKNEMNIGSVVERVQRSCRELEDGLDSIEGRVKDLYKSLVDVRMLLLGILSLA